MSTLIDRASDPVAIACTALAVVLTFVLEFLTTLNYFVSGIVAVLIAGALYILYQDIVEKQRLEDAENAKKQDLQRRIREQAKTEEELGKCVSCTAELPQGSEKCPECGYPVKHYTSIGSEESEEVTN